MIKKFSIQLKAAFLLIVFSLNTIVGFACAVGLDLGFNSSHHPDEEGRKTVVHVHADGEKHIHQKKLIKSKSHHSNDETIKVAVHVHADGRKHVHHEKKDNRSYGKSHHQKQANNNDKSKSDKDNCCNDKVINFEQLDKSVPNSLSIIHPVFFTAFVATYYNISILPHTDIVKDIKPFVRSYHPPIPDIRVAIQSFQI